MSTSLMISGVTVIDTHTGAQTVRDILVQGDRILKVAAPGALSVPDYSKTIDAKGQYAIPGLWDMLTHPLTFSEVEARMPQLFIAYGVTTVRSAGEPISKILSLQKKLQASNGLGPRIIYSGPFINSRPAWGNDKSLEADTPKEAYALVDSLAEAGVHQIKTYEMLLPEVFAAIAERAAHHGLKLSGHIPTRMTITEVLEVAPNYDIFHLGGQFSGMQFDCASNGEKLRDDRVSFLDENCRAFEKGYQLLSEMGKKVFKLPSDSDLDETRRANLINMFVDKGSWHTPTLTATSSLNDLGNETHSERIQGLRYLPAAFLEEDQKYDDGMDDRYAWGPWFMETVGLMHDAGIPMMAGTDHPPFFKYVSGQALHFELKAFVQAGFSPLAALRTATLNPAKFFEVENDYGSLSEGRYADIVLLNSDPLDDINNTRKIAGVIARGKYLDRSKLDEILAAMIGK